MSATKGRSWYLGPLAAGAVLLVFWAAMLASLRDKSLTVDEPGHVAAGYTYWRFNDYRINPENGNLPQRWMAIPLLFSGYAFPSLDSEAWRRSDEWTLHDQWFYRLGNPASAMIFRGRAMSGLLAVALGALVWWWSRRLFGPVGGMVSLLLFVLDPTLLANGALMTSDTASALFLFASLLAFWSVLHRLTPGRILLSALLLGALFVSKMSAVIIVPVAAALGVVRLFAGPPPSLEIGGRRILESARSRALAFAALAAVQVAVIALVIWGSYGFRYRAFASGSPADTGFGHPWTEVLGSPPAAGQADGRPAIARLFEVLRAHRILPEAYLYGAAHVWKYSQARSAFLNGHFRITGWRSFFPYTFLVKTPLAIFGVMALALFALRRQYWYGTLPLWMLFGIYWAAAIANPLNIGHRHILPTYPLLFVLCGAAGCWLSDVSPTPGAAGKGGARPLILGGLLAALALETAACFPNYLAYFNLIGGGADEGYRHLVDSSLDWGQDLPAVKRYLDQRGRKEAAYFSYFGSASPDYYQIPAKYLFGVRGQDISPPVRLVEFPTNQVETKVEEMLRQHPEYEVMGEGQGNNGWTGVMFLLKPAALSLGPGTYLISATMLQPVMYDLNGPLGPWNQRYERNYQLLYAAVKPLLGNDLSARRHALSARRPSEWRLTLAYFDLYRFARLTAYLRRLAPAANVNHSILVYRLSEADLRRAIDGPPPELGEDVPAAAGMASSP